MKVEAEAPARVATPSDGEAKAARRSPAAWVAVAVVAVLAAGIVMRFVTLSEMWLDEALTVNISRLPLRDIPEWLRHDGAPPLYYFMLNGWTDLFGTSNFAVRSLSAVISVATLPAIWFAGRRIAGRTGAWVALLVMASSPFAIQFGSEARMYSLMMLLVTLGYLAVRRLLERPSLGRQAVVALITGLLLYTQYWAFYLIAVVGALLAWQAWHGRDVDQRHAARAAAVALVAGVITFLPWIPTFLYQSAHTGTPWGDPVFVTASFAFAIRDFAGGEHSEAYVLLVVLIMLTLVAVFGRAIDRYRIELDVRTRPGVRAEALVWVATLVLGGAFAFIAHSTFAGRYASVLYPLFALVVAYGITVFADTRVRAVLLGVVVVIGLVSGARNVFDDRTEAGVVAEAIRARAKPGDVVLYCPDQLGPSVSRLLAGTHGLQQLTFPRGDRPALVDWVDYKERRDAALMREISSEIKQYGSLRSVPVGAVGNTRNDMYLASEAIRFLQKNNAGDLNPAEISTLGTYKKALDGATKFIPLWVKVAVAIALGLGTMIGWRRIVVTVGEKIGKTHMTYAQGASAELVAMSTIAAADMYGLPVSTTHVLSSGVAGAMTANGSGLQWSTIRNLVMAWVLTMPAAILLSGVLYVAFRHFL